MTEDQFSSLVKDVLRDDFESLEYKFADDCFFLNRSQGFRNIVSFDFDGNQSFRVFVGIDYPYDHDFDEDVPPDGARLCRYFSGGSLSENPRDIFFANTQQLVRHLERFKGFFMKEIKPNFFDIVKTPEDYADKLSETECIVKFEIYRNEGLNDKAINEAGIVIDSYKNMLDIPRIRDFIDNEVKAFLSANT